MKKKKYLPLYYKWMETGKIPRDGLCHSLGRLSRRQLKLFAPTPDEADEHGHWRGHWGVMLNVYFPSDDYSFNEFRQTVLLFVAAMNGEL